ncbi:hypothetical protein N320_05345, partial [Buceros rhinoceros silvestris]
TPPSVGQKKRPKSAILARDTVGLGGRLLTALHMATCLSQLDQVSPGRGGDGQKTLLHQTRSALEPPPRLCREVPRCTTDVHQQGHSGEWPCDRSERSRGVSGCLGHISLKQDEEGMQEHSWDHLEIFRYPQALEIGKGDTVQASPYSPRVPGRA